MRTPVHGLILLALAVASLAALLRWEYARRRPDPFQPAPDALEYAAGAQALAQSGRYFLQVGPERIQPRYPPGWSLLLAPAALLGVSGERLWRVTGLFGAAHAALLAVAAFMATRAWLRGRTTSAGKPAPGHFGALVSAAVAGLGWCVTPASLHADTAIMADEPAAFLVNASLVLLALGGLSEGAAGGNARRLCVAGGALAGAAVAVHTAMVLVLPLPVAVLLAGAARLHGRWPAARRAAWVLAGAAVPLIGVGALLAVSGHPAWRFGNYTWWEPVYANFDDVFALRFALVGNPPFAEHTGGVLTPHVALAVRLLLGLGQLSQPGLGRWWPAAGWACGLVLVMKAGPRRRGLRVAALAAAALLVSCVVVFSVYFFPAVRFYLSAAAWCWVALAVAAGVLCQTKKPAAVALAAIGVAAAGLLAVASARPFLRPQVRNPRDHATRSAVRRWLELTDRERRDTAVPFDPVRAQACGVLHPAALRTVREWGALPPTYHVLRARERGLRLSVRGGG